MASPAVATRSSSARERVVRRILVASDGRPIPDSVIDAAARLATSAGGRRASIRVFSVARIFGTSLGLPMPGLLPTRQEWQEQRELVAAAVRAFKDRGFKAEGGVVATRKATKQILQAAERLSCDAIVMAADPPRHRLIADLMWTQEAHRVRRRSRLPVHLVPTVTSIENEAHGA